jgi:hypothetical protein
VADRIRWEHRPLLQWFASYPVLLLEAVGLVLVCWHALARSFGIPSLFWDDDPWLQAFGGVGVGLLAVDLGLVGYLLDGQRSWWAMLGAARSGEALDPRRVFARYLRATTLPIVVACMAGFVTVPQPDGRGFLATIGSVLPFLVLAPATALGVGLLVARGVAAVARSQVVAPSADAVPPPSPGRIVGALRRALFPPSAVQRRIDGVDAIERPNHVVAYYYFLARLLAFALVGGVVYGLLHFRPSVPFLVCLLLGNLALAYGYLRRFHAERVFGILVVSFVAYALLNAPGGHQTSELDYCELDLVPVETLATRAPARPLVDEAQALGAWEGTRRGKGPLVVLAVDGGGLRAAVWAATVMTRLEEEIPGFLYQVRVVTGASGGVVGAGTVIASLQAPGAPQPYADRVWTSGGPAGAPLSRRQLLDAIGRESLSAVGRTLVFQDLLAPAWLHPRRDRGLSLERAWESASPALGAPFVALAEGERAAWRPSLIVSPVIVEDGRRLLISNLDTAALARTRLPGLEDGQNVEAIEFFKAFPQAERLRLSTALRWNATFPYVTPAAELPTRPARRVVDAGYLDEHGVDLAGRWMWAHQDWLREHTEGVLFIEVPDGRAMRAKRTPEGQRRKWWARGTEGLIGPLEALLVSREAAAGSRNDHLVSMLAETFRRSKPGFFCRAVFEPDPRTLPQSLLERWLRRRDPKAAGTAAAQDVALSWRLTAAERQALTTEAIDGPGSRERLAAVATWWKARVAGCVDVAACACKEPMVQAAAVEAECCGATSRRSGASRPSSRSAWSCGRW